MSPNLRMSMPRAAASILVAAALLAPSQARAQRPPDPPRGGGPSAGPAGGPESADDLAETLEIYMIAKMKRDLSLTHDQEVKIVPLIQDLSAARREHRRARFLDMTRLRPLAEDPASSEEEIRRVLSHMEEGEKTFRSREAGTLDQVRAILSARQQAQFIFFQERFRKEVQQRLREFRDGAAPDRPMRGPRRPGAPPLPDDE
jgi:Spy/CpxP family protein refolding chaperone